MVNAAICSRLPKYYNLLKSFSQAFYMRSLWGYGRDWIWFVRIWRL